MKWVPRFLWPWQGLQMCNLSGMHWSLGPDVHWEHINTHKLLPTLQRLLYGLHGIFCLKKLSMFKKVPSVWPWPRLMFLHGQTWVWNQRKVPRIAFLFWPGLSPPGSGRTLGCTCKRTSSRAHSSSPGRRGPAEGGSLPASCGQRASLTDKSWHVKPWNHSVRVQIPGKLRPHPS